MAPTTIILLLHTKLPYRIIRNRQLSINVPFVLATNFAAMQVLLVNSTYAEQVRDVRIVPDTVDTNDDITQLVASDGGEYIYALTAQQVSILMVAFQ